MSDSLDKEQLYGEYLKDFRRKARMSEQLARKSLDLPDNDEMQNVGNKTTVGMGWRELGLVGVLTAAAGIGGNLLANREAKAPEPTPPAIVPADTDTDTVNVLGFAE